MGRVTEGKEKIRARREGWHGWHGASSLLSSSFIITAAEQQLQNNIYIYINTQNKCERISKAYGPGNGREGENQSKEGGMAWMAWGIFAAEQQLHYHSC